MRSAGELADWARSVLEDPSAVVVDTETTGLEPDARVIEIAVLAVTGEVLVNTLVDPGIPVPGAATAIHGIGTADLAGAPSFGTLAAGLRELLSGRRVLGYNVRFDLARLRHELTVLWGEPAADRWLSVARFEDVMLPYSEFVAEPGPDGCRRQRLGGGHRALADCHAVLGCLRQMAAAELSRLVESSSLRGRPLQI